MASARTSAPDRAPRTPTTAMLARGARASIAGPPISVNEAPALAANCAARLAGAASATTDPSATDAASSASERFDERQRLEADGEAVEPNPAGRLAERKDRRAVVNPAAKAAGVAVDQLNRSAAGCGVGEELVHHQSIDEEVFVHQRRAGRQRLEQPVEKHRRCPCRGCGR